jgi:putative addiction module killer protein
MEIRKTETFAKWLDGLQDLRGRARVQARIERLALGLVGDVKPIGEGVAEMRIDHGPGYRVYFLKRGKLLIVLLAGGSKRNQKRDIEKALKLASEVGERMDEQD